ncbi:amino acid transporter [Amylocystis lapponica]|nr:amino acid transporter [Amylocystis lapponica]
MVQSYEDEPLLAVDAPLDQEDIVPESEGVYGQPTRLASTAFLIFNRIIGTRYASCSTMQTTIFATPSVILRSSGSVGLSLVMWLIGAAIAACGTAVYVELGTGLPRNGGEKNYLEFIYRRPRFLTTCTYAAYACLSCGWEAASCSVFGEYVLHAISPSRNPSSTATRLAGILCVTFALAIHGTRPKWGIHLQNTLGAAKLFVLIGIAFSGFASLAGVPGFSVEDPPDNFNWGKMWEGSGRGGVSAFVTGLFTVVWSYVGYSNANYALSEVRDPVRTIRRAAPLAVLFVTLAYLFVNIAYFAVVQQRDILGSGRIVAALFFGKLWGLWAERILSGIVAMSTFANVLAVMFTQGRVVQELGREGILPNKPFGAPVPGLFTQWFITTALLLSVPPGDAYLFMLNTARVAPAVPRVDPVVLVFFLSNVFLVFAPLIPPAPGFSVYEHFHTGCLHALVGCSVSLAGIAYWYVWSVWMPRRGGYALLRERVRQEDGTPHRVVRRVKVVAGQDMEE